METSLIISVELPTTSDLFKKHFNDMGQTGFLHPNMEAFFNDLNNVCKIEDALKIINAEAKQLLNPK